MYTSNTEHRILLEQRVAHGFANVVPVGPGPANLVSVLVFLFLAPGGWHGDVGNDVDGVGVNAQQLCRRGFADAVAVIAIAQHDLALFPYVAPRHSRFAHWVADNDKSDLIFGVAGHRDYWLNVPSHTKNMER